MTEFKGNKDGLFGDLFNGGSSSSSSTSNTVLSQDAIEAILCVGEGPILGLEDGYKSFYVGETPLVDNNGNPNFYDRNGNVISTSFTLNTFYGAPEGQNVTSLLGGFASSVTVNTPFAFAVPIVRTVTQHNIDYIDLRILINALYFTDADGDTNDEGMSFRIEWKRQSESVYNPVIPMLDLASTGTTTTLVDRGPRAFWQSTEPAIDDLTDAVWFDSSDSDQPHIISSGAWADAPISALTTSIANAPFLGFWEWERIAVSGSVSTPRAWQGNTGQDSLLFSPVGGSPRTGDYWLQTDTSALLYFNGTSWVTANDGVAAAPVDDDAFAGSGVIATRAKVTTSPVVWQVRFPVPNVDENLNIRVTKTFPDSVDISGFSHHRDVTFESYSAIVAQTFSHPNLAIAQLYVIATNNFTSVPDFSGIYKGRIIKVPSNYNATTRTYSGVWDGTWQMAYTDNPAYIVKDLVENTTYGMGAYYQITLSDWDVYDAGVWCDHIVPSGQPRFTFNGVISEARIGREAIDYICGIFAGRFVDDGNGSGRILIDRPDTDAVQLFTKENVEGGVFTYGFTDVTQRYNDLTIVFTNPDLSWKEDRRRLFNQPAIDDFGRIPYNFIAYGCITENEAYLRGRYVLITGLTETQTVTFKTSRHGNYLQPYDIILIADDAIYGMPPAIDNLSGYFLQSSSAEFPIVEAEEDELLLISNYEPANSQDPFERLTTGRTLVGPSSTLASVTDGIVNATGSILTATDARTVILRDAIYLEPGFTYLVTFQTNDGPIEYTVDPTWTGTKYDLKVTTDLAPLPERATFALRVLSLSTVPKPYRVIAVKSDGGDQVEVTAIEVNRTKWNYIDGVPDEEEEPEYEAVWYEFEHATSGYIQGRPAVDWVGRKMYSTRSLGAGNSTIICHDLDTRELVSEDLYSGAATISGYDEPALWIEEYGWFISAATFPSFDYRMVIFDPVTKAVVTVAPDFWPPSSIEDPYGNNGFTYKLDESGKIILCVFYTIGAKCHTATYDPVEDSWEGWNSTGNQLGGISPSSHIWHPQYFPVTKGISSGTSNGFYVNCGPGLAYVDGASGAAEYVTSLPGEVVSLWRMADDELVIGCSNGQMMKVNVGKVDDEWSVSYTWTITTPTNYQDMAQNAGGAGGTHDADRTTTKFNYYNANGTAGVMRTGNGSVFEYTAKGILFGAYITSDAQNRCWIISDDVGSMWYVELIPVT